MPREFVLGVYQSPSPLRTLQQSLNEAVAAIHAVADSRTTTASTTSSQPPALLLFCELFLGGYGSGSLLQDEAHSFLIEPYLTNKEALPDEHPLQPLCKACASAKVGIVIGLSEKTASASVTSTTGEVSAEETKRLWYNSALFIDDEGMFRACYRKVHLWGAYEGQFFTPGSDLQRGMVNYHGVQCGVLICFDVEFPESVRSLAFGPTTNAEIVLVPTALANAFNARVTVPSRAFENGIVVMYANEMGEEKRLPGTKYCGLSVVSLPDGEEAVRMVGDGKGHTATASSSCVGLGVAVVDLDSFKEARERNDYRNCRRPDAYLV